MPYIIIMEITIRPAVKDDCQRIMELVQELATYEKEPEAVTVSFDHFVNSGFGDQPVWWALVATVDGKVEGFALYYIRYSTWKGQRMYLEDLVVTEQQRRKGLGQLLFDELIHVAKEKQFTGITWQVLDWNEPAIHFYKKLGEVTFDSGWLNCALPL